MTLLRRRAFVAGLAAAGFAAGCSNGVGSGGAAAVDARVDSTLTRMYSSYPGTRDLAEKSAGMLVMPLMTEAGFGVGGAYGRGALRVGGATVDYYSAARASIGPQIGAQQYSHVLFFMTAEALEEFRRGPGWAAGADIEYVFRDLGEAMTAETTTTRSPVIAIIFGQAGLRLGATLEGTKYTRIIP
jgi:lipid-binding SYLF domain-containing protein